MYTADQLTDFVNDWLSNNPERLGHLYNDNSAYQAWKREAAERIQNRDVATQSGADVLEAFAGEAEANAVPTVEWKYDNRDRLVVRGAVNGDAAWTAAEDFLAQFDDDTTTYSTGLPGGEGLERLDNGTFELGVVAHDKPRYDVYKRLDSQRDEPEAPYDAIQLSRNEDGDYLLIDLGEDPAFNFNAECAVKMAQRALHYHQLSADNVLDTEKSYQVDASDPFVADRGKWRMFYGPRVKRYDVYKRLDSQRDEPEAWTLLGQELDADQAYQVASSEAIDTEAREEAVVCYAGTKKQADNDEIF